MTVNSIPSWILITKYLINLNIPGRVLCIDWSPCGNFIASGSIDSVRLWDVEKGHAIQRLITGRSKNKETIVWSIILMDNLTIVSGDSR